MSPVSFVPERMSPVSLAPLRMSPVSFGREAAAATGLGLAAAVTFGATLHSPAASLAAYPSSDARLGNVSQRRASRTSRGREANRSDSNRSSTALPATRDSRSANFPGPALWSSKKRTLIPRVRSFTASSTFFRSSSLPSFPRWSPRFRRLTDFRVSSAAPALLSAESRSRMTGVRTASDSPGQSPISMPASSRAARSSPGTDRTATLEGR